MLDSEWQDVFQKRILERGEDYADNGCVDILQNTHERISAIVHGSSDYKVEIILNNGIPEEMHCSCPYAEDGSHCKHMAAVLYEAESFSKGSESSHESNVTTLLENASPDQLISFLKELAMNDPAVANMIRVIFSEKLSSGDMTKLKREADDIFRDHEIKGFINYHEAFQFQADIDAFLTGRTDALLDHGAYTDAFEITTYVFVKLAHTDIDDDGEIQGISSTCYDIWKRIISSCTEAEYKRFKAWFKEHAYGGKLIDYMEEILQEFVETELASDDDLREQLQNLDAQIDAAGQSINCPMVFSSVGPSVNAVRKRMELMHKFGATEEQIEAYRYSHRHFRAVRKEYMEEAEKAGDHEKLIALLMEGKKLDADDSHIVSRYSAQLADIYHQEGEQEKERNERYEEFIRCRGSNMKTFRVIKTLCPEKEWPKYRDGMIAAVKDKGLKCEIFAEEKLTRSLYELVFEDVKIPVLDRYGPLLAEEHSAEILNIYEKHVRSIAEQVRNRSGYGRLTDYLSRMQIYPGGKDLTSRLASEWIDAYPTRKLMVKELEAFL